MEGFKIDIKSNFEKVKENIEKTKSDAGLNHEIQVVAVTKTKPVDIIKEALSIGLLDIGENKVQELTDKIKVLGSTPRYHMIGHLQSNKVKYIAKDIHLIHSLDSISLAKEIDKQAKKLGVRIKVLVQLNSSNEDSKFGIQPNELFAFLEELDSYENLKVKGLMTMAALTNNELEIRKSFNKVYELREKALSNNYLARNANILSMGMTNDYMLAIKEGSNMLRIGTAIFGERK